MKPSEMTNETVTFEKWMKVVGEVAFRMTGMEWEDVIGDWMFRDAFDDGQTALEAGQNIAEEMRSEMADMEEFDSLLRGILS